MDNSIKVRLLNSEGKQYKKVPPKYISHFNKLTKVYDEHDVVCEKFPDDLSIDSLPSGVLIEMLNEKISDHVLDRIRNSEKIL